MWNTTGIGFTTGSPPPVSPIRRPGRPRGCGGGVSAQPLDHHGHALSATDAHGLEADRLVGVLEPVEERRHDAGSGHAEGVAEGDGAAVDVELVPLDAEVAGRGDDL